MFVTMQYEKINSAKMTRKEHVRCSVLRILEYVAINSANKYQVLQYYRLYIAFAYTHWVRHSNDNIRQKRYRYSVQVPVPVQAHKTHLHFRRRTRK
jgi:hypothetical protein